jgi:hypothetical protein
MIVALDADRQRRVKKEQIKMERATDGRAGFSSPLIDGEAPLIRSITEANLAAFDVNTGKQLWLQNLGTIPEGFPGFRRRQALRRH